MDARPITGACNFIERNGVEMYAPRNWRDKRQRGVQNNVMQIMLTHTHSDPCKRAECGTSITRAAQHVYDAINGPGVRWPRTSVYEGQRRR